MIRDEGSNWTKKLIEALFRLNEKIGRLTLNIIPRFEINRDQNWIKKSWNHRQDLEFRHKIAFTQIQKLGSILNKRIEHGGWVDYKKSVRNPISDVENGSKFGIDILFSRSTSMEMEIKKFLLQIQIHYHQVLFLTNHLRSADLNISSLRCFSKLVLTRWRS